MSNEHNIPSHLRMQGGTDAEHEGESYEQADTRKAAANREEDTESGKKDTTKNDAFSSGTSGDTNSEQSNDTAGIP